jgi:hypothetical protein
MAFHLPLTTTPSAARAYHLGIDHLLAGRPTEASEAFRHAVTLDAHFALGHAALAAALMELGEREAAGAAIVEADAHAVEVTRRERHHVAVVALVLAERVSRASALGREHLVEFPEDALKGRIRAWNPGNKQGEPFHVVTLKHLTSREGLILHSVNYALI